MIAQSAPISAIQGTALLAWRKSAWTTGTVWEAGSALALVGVPHIPWPLAGAKGFPQHPGSARAWDSPP
jgi:hypothetical protein